MPYEDKYPADFTPYPLRQAASPRERLIRSYKNGLRWSVDAFFEKVLPEIDLSSTVLVYTSDHGQSLMDRGYMMSHCSTGPNIADGEALVPLFVVTGEGGLRNEFAASVRRFAGAASHFDIFPTLLLLLGFDRAAVEARYGGAGLFGEAAGDRRFLSGHRDSVAWTILGSASATE